MKILGFPAGMFQTNCYIVVGEDSRCVVIDPGQDAAPRVHELLESSGLTPEAVLLTHGHLDHTWNVREVADHYGIPTLIHPDDRYMLTDPAKGMSADTASFLKGQEFAEPKVVVEMFDGEELEYAGLRFSVDHAPGHSEGSVSFTTTADIEAEGGSMSDVTVMFGGDVLFNGGIGRTDLPGGDHEVLLASIAKKFLSRDDDVVVLPGHGPQTTIGQERAANPFLRGLG